MLAGKKVRSPAKLILLALILVTIGGCAQSGTEENDNTVQKLRTKLNDRYSEIEQLSNYCVDLPELSRMESDGDYTLISSGMQLRSNVAASITRLMNELDVSILRCSKTTNDGKKLSASQIYNEATGFVFAGTANGFTRVYGAPRSTFFDEETGQGTFMADRSCAKDCWYLFTFH